MNRIVSTCALVAAGVVVLMVSAQAAQAFAACEGDMSSMPVPSVLWLVSAGLFSLAALGQRANGKSAG
jgi:hypothetical protein